MRTGTNPLLVIRQFFNLITFESQKIRELVPALRANSHKFFTSKIKRNTLSQITCSLFGPEWPSPHDCTSSVSDELVVIQLLNLVQSQRLSHTFYFWATPSRDFFFTWGPRKKYIPTYPAPLLMLQIFSSNLSFFLLSLSMLQLTPCHRWCSEKN